MLLELDRPKFSSVFKVLIPHQTIRYFLFNVVLENQTSFTRTPLLFSIAGSAAPQLFRKKLCVYSNRWLYIDYKTYLHLHLRIHLVDVRKNPSHHRHAPDDLNALGVTTNASVPPDTADQLLAIDYNFTKNIATARSVAREEPYRQ